MVLVLLLVYGGKNRTEWNVQNKTEEKAVIPESCIPSQDPKTKLLGRDYYVDDAN